MHGNHGLGVQDRISNHKDVRLIRSCRWAEPGQSVPLLLLMHPQFFLMGIFSISDLWQSDVVFLHKVPQGCCLYNAKKIPFMYCSWELCSLSPNHIHVSVSSFYIFQDRSIYFLLQNRQTYPGNI
jgi:hypothetical protein